jgi:hypothetical protein
MHCMHVMTLSSFISTVFFLFERTLSKINVPILEGHNNVHPYHPIFKSDEHRRICFSFVCVCVCVCVACQHRPLRILPAALACFHSTSCKQRRPLPFCAASISVLSPRNHPHSASVSADPSTIRRSIRLSAPFLCTPHFLVLATFPLD